MFCVVPSPRRSFAFTSIFLAVSSNSSPCFKTLRFSACFALCFASLVFLSAFFVVLKASGTMSIAEPATKSRPVFVNTSFAKSLPLSPSCCAIPMFCARPIEPASIAFLAALFIALCLNVSSAILPSFVPLSAAFTIGSKALF